jgi:hypothetical protein
MRTVGISGHTRCCLGHWRSRRRAELAAEAEDKEPVMKKQLQALLPWLASALVVALAAGTTAGAEAALVNQSAAQTQPSTPGQPGQSGMDEKQAAAMMAERQKMMENMRAMDRKLEDLVAKMNAARGDDKVNAIATVVSELATQRIRMHDDMMGMQARMMSHMMQHMQSMQGGAGMMHGQQGGAAYSMENCPMMKEMSQPAAGAGHEGHHPGQ